MLAALMVVSGTNCAALSRCAVSVGECLANFRGGLKAMRLSEARRNPWWACDWRKRAKQGQLKEGAISASTISVAGAGN